ncbi:MAG: hypothetical protein AAB885_00155, partial [Patescibacteria group bacterium]
SFNNCFLIYITADLSYRYHRSKDRGDKSGENTATLEQFMEQERAKTELWISQISSRADFKIVNNGTLEEFTAEVQKILAQILKEKNPHQ